jgi:hypothetical protein
MIGLNGQFVVLWFAYWLLGIVSAGTAVLIGSAVSNIKTAMESAPAVFVPQMLFAGFYISASPARPPTAPVLHAAQAAVGRPVHS